MADRRVAITGLGWVTSLGTSLDDVWQKLLDGTSFIHDITTFDASEYTTRFAGEVNNWPGIPSVDKRELKRMDRFAQFALGASIDAVADSGIDFSKEDPWRCGVNIGSGVGGIGEFADGHQKLIEKGPARVSPFMVPKMMCNAGAGNVSIHFGIKGPNSAIATACASAGHSIGEAAQSIRHNVSDVMIAGGSEAAVTAMGLACFTAIKALSKRNDDPQKASRPFDKDRDGFILAEGAGILILEEMEHAKARGAKIYAEFTGYGQSADGYHITAPDENGTGAAHAMKRALADGKLNATDVDYINAHGTSTPLGDLAETRAIKSVFDNGEVTKIPVSSTKSMTGHLLGASGGVEAIIACKALHTGMVPPTINHNEPSEGCDLDYVPNTARQVDPKVAISNSFGFGGHNVCLAFNKV
ncbi:beta-ketoacyl-ACP synthase II [Mucisphaera sp.]|uniref:beta-ketoacyl-ACP synthase II n=1 Tax=Mucisphaera sp. TaxID=2913024 RepID=UPI003D122203